MMAYCVSAVAIIAFYFIGNALFDKLSSASDANITPETVLINGRTIQDVATLVARGDILRDAALEEGVKDVSFNAIIENTAIDGSPVFSEKLLRFFLGGGIGFPVLSEEDTFLVFYSPALEVTLVTSWTKDGGIYKLRSARYIPSEKIFGQNQKSTRPSWIDAPNIPTVLTDGVMNHSRITSESVTTTVRLLREITVSAPAATDIKVVRDRFALAIGGISNAVIPCGSAISAKTDTLVTLRQAALKTNMGNFAGDEDLVPVGGHYNDQFGFRILVQRKNPAVLVLVAADTKANCKIDGAYVVDTMRSIQDN